MPRISSSGRGPYGRRAWSPRYTKSSCGIVTRHSWRTVSPPTPESNTPTGRRSTGRSYSGLRFRFMLGRLAFLFACVAVVLAPTSQARVHRAAEFTKLDTKVTMSDGVQIAVTYYTPAGTPPAGGWPALMMFHGLGQTRNAFELNQWSENN